MLFICIFWAAVSPSASAYKETLSTLRFAQRAQHVVNVPVVNEEAAPKLIRHLKEELARLRAVLSDSTARAVTDTVNSARPETLVQLMTINEARSRELTEDWLLRWRNEPDESAVSEHVCRVRLAVIAHAQNWNFFFYILCILFR